MPRSVLLATSLGIILHTVLGWCPQHVACASEAACAARPTAASHRHCQGHCHDSPAQSHGTTGDQRPTPKNPAAPCCDHADCLFVSSLESGAELVSQSDCSAAVFLTNELAPACEFAALWNQRIQFDLPDAPGQSARIARHLWLL